VIVSEFAAVECREDAHANGRRMRLEDLRTGRVRYLDALELETLIWLPSAWWDRLLDPSLRWSEDLDVTGDVAEDDGPGIGAVPGSRGGLRAT